MKIFIGADHRGFDTKEKLKQFLTSSGHEVVDKGAFALEPLDDYPDFAFAVAEDVASNPDSKGILICGSSIGVAAAANKVKNIFASNPRTVEETIEDKKHHNSNVLALSADNENLETMQKMIEVWLETEFEGGRHERRRMKILNYKN